MGRPLRFVPGVMYLGGFPGLREALNELGLTGEGPVVDFLLGQAVSYWEIEQNPRSRRHTSIDQKKFLRQLTLLTKCLNTAVHALGWHEDPDEFLDGQCNFPILIHLLAQRLPRADLVRFVREAGTISRAVSSLAREIETNKAKRGPTSHVPYDFFVEAVLEICERNNVKATISTNRVTSERGGRFLAVAKRLEFLLPQPMRSPTNEALAKRLGRSQERIRKGRSGSRPRSQDSAFKVRFNF